MVHVFEICRCFSFLKKGERERRGEVRKNYSRIWYLNSQNNKLLRDSNQYYIRLGEIVKRYWGMSYEFLFLCICVYIYIFICINLQTDIHKPIHMPRGTMQSLTNVAVVFVMHKLKFPVPEEKQSTQKCKYKKYRQDDCCIFWIPLYIVFLGKSKNLNLVHLSLRSCKNYFACINTSRYLYTHTPNLRHLIFQAHA